MRLLCCCFALITCYFPGKFCWFIWSSFWVSFRGEKIKKKEKLKFWVFSGTRFPQMGNRFICMSKKDTKENGSRSKRMNRSQRKLLAEEEFLHRQALSMALHQHQLSQRFDGSMSRRIGSTSSRRLNLSDPFSNGKQVGFLIWFKTMFLDFCFFLYNILLFV